MAEGDCLFVLGRVADASVDSCVCDPPYGLSQEPDMVEVLTRWLAGDDYTHRGTGFMGKRWDSFVPGPAVWRECYRVLRPGGFLLAFGGTRTYDLLATAVRLAGFEIRDSFHWLYGTGWNKAGYLSYQLERLLTRQLPDGKRVYLSDGEEMALAPPFRHPQADSIWGWSSGLKPGHEPILVARKPLDGTVRDNLLTHGTGAYRVDACRVGNDVVSTRPRGPQHLASPSVRDSWSGHANTGPRVGRLPSNVVLSHSLDCRRLGTVRVKAAQGKRGKGSRNYVGTFQGDMRPVGYGDAEGMEETAAWTCAEGCAVAEVGRQSGERPGASSNSHKSRRHGTRQDVCYGNFGDTALSPGYADSGTAARFYPQLNFADLDDVHPFLYCAKASRAERDAGVGFRGNLHVSVKPVALLRWLARLVTPPGGLVADPFAGSGSLGVAAVLEGFRYFGVELEADQVEVARRRIGHYAKPPRTLRAYFEARARLRGLSG